MPELVNILRELELLQDNYTSRSLITVVKKLSSFKKIYKAIIPINITYEANPSFAFSAREIDSLSYEQTEEAITVKIVINFFGMQSVSSPLPLNLHEALIQDVSSDSYELNDFYNFFNQRAIELLAKSYIQRDVLNLDASTVGIWSKLLGLASEIYRNDKFIFYRLMSRGDLLFGSNHSATNISKLVEVFFGFKYVYIEHFIPRNVELQDNNRTKLGSQNCSLQENFVMGDKIVDIQNKCRIHIELEDVTDYLPNGDKHNLLHKVIKFLLDNHLVYDLTFHLKKNIKMVLRKQPLWLGWTTMVANHNQDIKQTIRLREQR